MDDSLTNLYRNTISIHDEKHFLIMQNISKKNADLYIHTYFSQIGDLLFYFNSFLILYVIKYNILSNEFIFKNNYNGNSITNLVNEIDKKKSIDPDIKNRIRIYEFFFRHIYAHGNLPNLINMLLAKDQFSPPFLMLTGENLRFLLDKQLLEKNRKFFNDVYLAKKSNKKNKFYKRKKIIEPLKDKKTYNFFYLLDEDITRTYLVSYAHTLMFQNRTLLNQSAKNNIANIDQLIVFGVMKNDKDKAKVLSERINYNSVRLDIDKLIQSIT